MFKQLKNGSPLLKLFLAILFSWLLCSLLYAFFLQNLQKYEVNNTERLTELLTQKTKHDVLFIGSSRVHFHINPKIVDSITNLSTYNAGIQGGIMEDFEMILLAYLENHPAPKILSLTIDLISFDNEKPMFNYPVYFPYAQKNKVIQQYLKKNGYLPWYKELFPFLRMTDYDDNTKGNLLKYWMGRTEINQGDFQYKGYISNTDVTIKQEPFVTNTFQLQVTKTSWNSLERIIELCQQKKITIMLSYAPEYKKAYQNQVKNADNILQQITNLAKQNQIPFFRDDLLELSNNPNYFANTTHLNKEGASVYSQYFGNRLKELHKNLYK
ncbi:MAG: hypothetical protein ACOVQE_01340 [Chitinophagaceae bacterium]